MFPFASHLVGADKQTAAHLTDVPAWAKEAVWYQIFPERFRNGDPSNDPTVSDIIGSWPHETPPQWAPAVWTADWYKLQPWEAIDDKGFYYHVQQRRYGGDVQGVIDKLDYLQSLGVNALYFNPLFESPSLHKYDATMYHHIDNNFGPDPAGDRMIWESENPADPSTWKWTSADRLFLRLVEEVHKRGMKIIIDGVFNHVGMTFWAFIDVRTNGEKSKYKHWFTIKQWDDPKTPENEFDYAGWYGVRELPELREDENGLAAEPREHVRSIVKRWMDPNGDGDPSDGIDGWRLDVAEMITMPFWREFRRWVREINPNAYLTGEVWWEDWNNNKMFNAAPWLRGDAFDAVMNYRWAREVCHFFIDKNNKIIASEFDRRLQTIRDDYRAEANSVLMNLLDSHDTDRLSSHIVNADAYYDKHVGVNDNRNYDVRKPNAREVQTQKLIALFQMTYLGAPMIYYGDEAGMWGADDPDCRKPMLWPDMSYENEASHPFSAKRPEDKNEFDNDLFQHYKTLIAIRNHYKALSLGNYKTLLANDANDTFAFLRSYKEEHAVVVINNKQSSQTVEVEVGEQLAERQWNNVLNPTPSPLAGKKLTVHLPPKSGIILVSHGS